MDVKEDRKVIVESLACSRGGKGGGKRERGVIPGLSTREFLSMIHGIHCWLIFIITGNLHTTSCKGGKEKQERKINGYERGRKKENRNERERKRD